MAEDAFVRMLLEAAAGNVADERDIELARAAARWAVRHGWRPYMGDAQGFVCERPGGLQFWVDDTPTRDALMVMVRLQPGTGWRAHARYPVGDLGEALDVLAGQRLIPPQFSTIGRRALEGHAEVLQRSAERLRTRLRYVTDDLGSGLMEVEALVFERAAESARRYAGAELAVMA